MHICLGNGAEGGDELTLAWNFSVCVYWSLSVLNYESLTIPVALSSPRKEVLEVCLSLKMYYICFCTKHDSWHTIAEEREDVASVFTHHYFLAVAVVCWQSVELVLELSLTSRLMYLL